MTKFEIEEFAQSGATEDLRRYALVTAQILNKTQLKAMARYFSRRYQFQVPSGEIPQATEGIMMAKSKTVDDEDEDIETMAEADEEAPIPQKKPVQDFGFGTDAPRKTVSRAQAEAEFNDIIKRRPKAE